MNGADSLLIEMLSDENDALRVALADIAADLVIVRFQRDQQAGLAQERTREASDARIEARRLRRRLDELMELAGVDTRWSKFTPAPDLGSVERFA
jgi:hypothetical protein